MVELEDGSVLKARAAFSCLVQPIPDDLVLCSRDKTGDYFILGIIDRPGAQDMTLAFPAAATLIADNGPVSLVSGQEVTLASGDRLNCFSEQAVHKSHQAVIDYDRVAANGSDLQANFKSILIVSRVINTMARQAIQKFMSYIRHTEDADQIKAGHMTRNVEGLYSMDSKNTVLVSKKDTKIDGERIFMG